MTGNPEIFKTKKAATSVAVSLSRPSKMPCYGYSLPAAECKVGSKLREVCGSVCSNCYAFERGNYVFPNVQKALYKRLHAIRSPLWPAAMIKLIKGLDYFRWHDSGDLVDLEHLNAIVTICKATPETKHWLPTKEKSLVLRYQRLFGSFPDNLTVRVSGAMVNGLPPVVPDGVLTSTVHTLGSHVDGYNCPCHAQDNQCKDCRACWDKSISNVSYLEH